MSEALWIVLIVNSLGVLGLFVKAYYDYKGKKEITKKAVEIQGVKVGNNPHPCQDHGERLIKLEGRILSLEEKIDIRFNDIKDDITRLFRKYNGMRK